MKKTPRIPLALAQAIAARADEGDGRSRSADLMFGTPPTQDWADCEYVVESHEALPALLDAAEERVRYERHLRNLLARIHRDDGAYTEGAGIDRSCQDADTAVVTMIQAAEERERLAVQLRGAEACAGDRLARIGLRFDTREDYDTARALLVEVYADRDRLAREHETDEMVKKALREQVEKLTRVAEAAKALRKDVTGAWERFEDEIRAAIGHTNYQVVRDKYEALKHAERAAGLLAEEKDHG